LLATVYLFGFQIAAVERFNHHPGVERSYRNAGIGFGSRFFDLIDHSKKAKPIEL